MRPMLAGLVVLTSATIGGVAQAQTDPASLLRKACVETGLDADRLDQVARAEGWVRLRITHTSGEATRTDAYHVGGGQVMLTGDAPDDATCAVTVRRPDADWRSGLEAQARDMGLQALPAGGSDAGFWFAPGGYALSYSYAPDAGGLVVSLSHAQVTTAGTDGDPAVVIESERVETAPH